MNDISKCGNITKRMEKNNETFMRAALCEAEAAAAEGEVPVGAVIVRGGQIIASAHNRTEQDKDPTAHAEILAIRKAAAALGGWRLPGCSMFVTIEPCSMCAGAIVWARIEKLYIGAPDPKAGACGSLYCIPGDSRLNHNAEIETGLLGEECSRLMKDFFRKLRSEERR